MIIQDLMQKLTIVKKKRHIIDKTFVQQQLEVVDKHEKNKKANEKKSRVDV
jgi:hypothetical protein